MTVEVGFLASTNDTCSTLVDNDATKLVVDNWIRNEIILLHVCHVQG